MLCRSVIPDLDREDEGSVSEQIVLKVAKDCAAFVFGVIGCRKLLSQRCSLPSQRTFHIQQWCCGSLKFRIIHSMEKDYGKVTK